MKAIESLKSRITSKNTITVQNEGGFISEMGFQWNPSATDAEIHNFEEVNKIILPNHFKSFLKISNGAMLYKDIQYGQWGCNILGLDELINMSTQIESWGYEIKPGWLVFASWLGDCDILIFDLNKYNSGDNNYILDGEQGESVDNWITVKGDFAKWLDRLIVSQGAKYWRWY